MLLLTRITLAKAIALLISNLDKIIIRTNIFSCYLSITLSLNISLNFIIIKIFNILKTLLINRIKITSIVNLQKTFNNCRDLLKLFYSLINNFCFLKKTCSIRRIKINY